LKWLFISTAEVYNTYFFLKAKLVGSLLSSACCAVLLLWD